jgi:hypothetical protein
MKKCKKLPADRAKGWEKWLGPFPFPIEHNYLQHLIDVLHRCFEDAITQLFFEIFLPPLSRACVREPFPSTFSESILCVIFVAIYSACPHYSTKLRPVFNNLTTALSLVAAAIALPYYSYFLG